jgi:ribosome-binding factor A
MPKDYPRSHRIGDFIQRELAQLIRTEVKDPRLSALLTVAEVRVNADLSHAKVYITALDERGPASVEILNHLSGFLRGHLLRRMRTRVIPQLQFVYDTTAEKGAQLSALIEAAVREDRDRQRDDGSTDDAGDDAGKT